MSRNDFESCTPDEFDAVVKAYVNKQEQQTHLSWEQARFLALYMLMPHTKEKLTFKDIAVFPWEKEDEAQKKVPISTRESFEKAKERFK